MYDFPFCLEAVAIFVDGTRAFFHIFLRFELELIEYWIVLQFRSDGHFSFM